MTFLTYVSLQLLDLYLNTRVILVSSKYNNLFRFGFVFALYPPGILFVYMLKIVENRGNHVLCYLAALTDHSNFT